MCAFVIYFVWIYDKHIIDSSFYQLSAQGWIKQYTNTDSDLDEEDTKLLFYNTADDEQLESNDDEDSNAEDFYANEYPEESDNSANTFDSETFASDVSVSIQGLALDDLSEDEESGFSTRKYGW